MKTKNIAAIAGGVLAAFALTACNKNKEAEVIRVSSDDAYCFTEDAYGSPAKQWLLIHDRTVNPEARIALATLAHPFNEVSGLLDRSVVQSTSRRIQVDFEAEECLYTPTSSYRRGEMVPDAIYVYSME